jgi:plastocyanin
MNRKSIAIIAGGLVAALVLAGTAFSRPSSTPTLKGVVGPGFTIKLTKGGKRVKQLKAGTYRFAVSDKSNFHNFTLEKEKPKKPHVEKTLSGTGATGSKTMTVKLVPGSWRVYCSIHEAQMHQDFRVVK